MPRAVAPDLDPSQALGRPERPRRREAMAVEALETRLLLATSRDLDRVSVAGADKSGALNLDPAASQGGLAVVADAPGEHSQSATAQPVPDSREVLVDGAVAPTEAPDMYRVSIGPETRALTVNLWSPETPTSAAIRLWVFDGSGRELGNFPVPPSADLSVVVRPLDPSAGDVVFVAVSHDNSGSPGDPGLYLLQITRTDDDASALAAAGPSTIVLVAFAPTLPSAAAPGGAFGSAVAPSGPTEADPPTGVGQGSGPAPLPIRSAGPSGGFFGDGGEAAPPLDLAADAVDRALFDLGKGPAEAVALLGSPDFVVDHRLEAAIDRAALPVRSISLKPVPPRPAEAGSTASDRPTADPETSDPGQDRAGLAIPFGAGLGIAALMGIGLILPDVASTVEAIRRRHRPAHRALTGG